MARNNQGSPQDGEESKRVVQLDNDNALKERVRKLLTNVILTRRATEWQRTNGLVSEAALEPDDGPSEAWNAMPQVGRDFQSSMMEEDEEDEEVREDEEDEEVGEGAGS